MKLSNEIKTFCTRIGHEFDRPELLLRALTHPSAATPGRPHNQRLEFLGDRVLNLVMAEALFHADRDAAEGQLAPRYNVLVRKETCAEVAREIELGPVLRIGRSEQQAGGRRRTAMLGDAMEALIAAIYLDAGFEAARSVVLRLWGQRIDRAEETARDPKTALQEWAQARRLPPPAYEVLERDGPDHAPRFTIAARLKTGESETATAASKRAAEQDAARALLDRMEQGS